MRIVCLANPPLPRIKPLKGLLWLTSVVFAALQLHIIKIISPANHVFKQCDSYLPAHNLFLFQATISSSLNFLSTNPPPLPLLAKCSLYLSWVPPKRGERGKTLQPWSNSQIWPLPQKIWLHLTRAEWQKRGENNRKGTHIWVIFLCYLGIQYTHPVGITHTWKTSQKAKYQWHLQMDNQYMELYGSGIYIDHVWIKLISQRGEVKIIEDCPGLSQDPSWPEPFLETSIFRHGCLALMGWHRRAWDDQSSPPPWCLQR